LWETAGRDPSLNIGNKPKQKQFHKDVQVRSYIKVSALNYYSSS